MVGGIPKPLARYNGGLRKLTSGWQGKKGKIGVLVGEIFSRDANGYFGVGSAHTVIMRDFSFTTVFVD